MIWDRASGSEFPLHRIIAVVVINLVGIVVQPHFIATGRWVCEDRDYTARVGLVVGNFLKRFCTVGWVLTALIAAWPCMRTIPSCSSTIHGKAWGCCLARCYWVPGLTGLMLACLLAALMSSCRLRI